MVAREGLIYKCLHQCDVDMEKLAWLAGLADGEACFTLRIHKFSHHSGLNIDPYFSLSMKTGEWVRVVSEILLKHGVKFRTRQRKGQTEIQVAGLTNTSKLITMLLPYSVVKKPLMEKLLQLKPRPRRNRFVPPDPASVREIATLVDFVREFNRRKNRPFKWTSRAILEHYRV